MTEIDLRHGDCREVLRTLDDESVSAVITDPPYELAFMGRAWDATGIAYDVGLWREVLRVLKPGAHLAASGGTRTHHRMACAIEDAGFEIRDSLAWLYGSGMVKSLDVSKAIDKAGGDPLAFRQFAQAYAAAVGASSYTHSDIDRHLGVKSSSCYWVREDHRGGLPPRHHWEQVRDLLHLDADLERLYDKAEREVVGTSGWSNSAHHFVPGEDHTQRVRLAVTAPASDAAQRWQGWGTALAPAHEPIVLARKPLVGTVARTVLAHGTGSINVEASKTSEGRWPKNVIIDEHVAAGLGERARYFYCAKAPQSERPKLDGQGWPTVKPLTLMRWLVRLLAPPGGLVLDPFAGTGSTLQAADLEGFASIGIERDEFAYRLACKRLGREDPFLSEGLAS